jgi:acyl phosphate:glycerol-3-phosphate acyltransferase
MLEFVLLITGSYLIGSVPTAYLAVKWRYKKDIRNYGSGAVGASNVIRNFSKPLGILIFIWDLGKGALAVWVAQLLDMQPAFQAGTALAVVIGHNWPVFLNFNAGRGVATSAGAAMVLMPWLSVIVVVGEAVSLLIHNSAICVLIGFGLMPIAAFILQEPLAISLGLSGLFLILVVRRLTAPLSERSKGVKTGELLLYRFLFDRDIRDGKAWTNYKAAEADSSPEKQTKT